MGDDEANLIRLWRQKRSEIEPEDLSGNLIVRLHQAGAGRVQAASRAATRRATDAGNDQVRRLRR